MKRVLTLRTAVFIIAAFLCFCVVPCPSHALQGYSVNAVAGTGVSGYSGDGGDPLAAQMSRPTAVTFDAQGRMFIVDYYYNHIRMVSNGTITTIAGLRSSTTPSCGVGNNVPATSSPLGRPHGIAIDAAGNMYFSEPITCNRIRMVLASDQTITTIAGNGLADSNGDGTPGLQASLNSPLGLAVDQSGNNLYIAESGSNCIRVLNVQSPPYIINTFAGFCSSAATPTWGYQNGSRTSARFNSPSSLAIDASGNIYVADTGNNAIRMISGNTVTTIAGLGPNNPGYSGDNGPATEAMLWAPRGVAVDSGGNIYFSEQSDYIIRRIDPHGIISTIAGMAGQLGSTGDGGPAIQAKLAQPFGVAVNANNIYFTEYSGNKVRVLTDTYGPEGTMSINNGAVATNSFAVTLNLSCNDSTGSGCAKVLVSNDTGTTWSSAIDFATSLTWTLAAGNDGPRTVTVRFKDYAGNNSVFDYSASISLDTGPPDTFLSSYPTQTMVLPTASFSFSASKTVQNYQCSLDAASFVTCSSPADYAGLANGFHTFNVRAVDLAGNIDPTPATYTWLVDILPPVTTASPSNGVFNAAQNVVLTCADSPGAGCDATYYTTDGTTPTTASNRYTGPIALATDATTVLKYWSVDAVGHAEQVRSATYIIDIRNPVVSITTPVNNYVYRDMYSINGTAGDEYLSSGISRVELQITDGTNYLSSAHLWEPTPQTIIANGTASWTHNTTTAIWTSDAWYTITATAYDFAGNHSQTTSRFHYYNGSPAYTTLSLELSSPAILQNGTLDVTGVLTRLPDNGTDLSGLPVMLVVTDPLSVATTTLSTSTYNALGHYKFLGIQGFTHKGVYTVRALFPGDGALSNSSSDTHTVLVGSSAGYAIIVEGKLPPPSEGLESHNKTANRIYRRLKERGFDDLNISYLNYDTTQTGVLDAPSKSAVQHAVEQWALSRMNGVPAPLYVIMVDHGSPGAFHLGSETITPADLGGWMANLESGLSPAAKAEKRVVIIGACYSGSFIPALSSGPTGSDAGRIIITSAAMDEESYKGPMEPDQIRSGEFFLEELFMQLDRGQSFRASFEEAAARTKTLTRKGGGSGNSNAPYFDGATQHPQLDDNGDNLGSNILSAGGDGNAADGLFLGVGGSATNAGNTPADLTAVTEAVSLGASSSSAVLWAQANDNTRVGSVWLEVRKPSTTLAGAGGANTEQLSIDIPREFMQQTGSDPKWYPMNAILFNEAGMYELFYYTRDKYTGQVSSMKRSVVYKDKSANAAPNAFDLLLPADGAQVKTVLLLDWEDSVDPDGLTYTVQVAKDAQFTTVDFQKSELTESMLAIGSEAGLQDSTVYYWKVMAVDGYGELATSPTRSFSTNNTNGLPGMIKGYVLSAQTGAGIGGAQVSANGSGTVASASNGAYVLSVASGNLTLAASAGGYAGSGDLALVVAAGDVITRNIQLNSLSPVQFLLTAGATGSGSGSISSSPNGLACGSGCAASFNANASVSLTATADSGSTFTGWTGACAGAGSCTISMNSNKSVSAVFVKNAAAAFTVTPSAGPHGSISPSLPQTVNQGAAASFAVSPDTGYHIDSVTGCNGSLTNTTYTTGAVNANCTVAAVFALDVPNAYAVTPSAGAGGSISPATARTVISGATTTFIVTSNAGFSIASVTGCGGTLAGNIYTTGPITANCTVTALFKALFPDGHLVDPTQITIADALRAFQIAAGLIIATPNDLAHGDVAPLVNGKPQPDGKIDINDVVVVLRASVGLVSW